MRIVFMGSQTWGLISLEAALASGHEVALVVTHPEPTEAYALHFNDSVAEFATAKGLPLAVAKTTTPRVLDQIRAAQAGVILSSNWRRRLPDDALAAAKHGGINVHRSLLPRFCGFAPINWAVACGATETGVTIHRMVNDFDLGDIVAQEAFPIGPTETATEVFHKTNPVVRRLVPAALDRLAAGETSFLKQDPAEAEFFHARSEAELRIDWQRPRREIYNLVRAQSDPFLNAFTTFKGTRLWIKTAALPERRYRGTPGRLFERVEGAGVVALCGRDAVEGQGIVLGDVMLEGQPPCRSGELFTRLDVYLGS
jgi:methionyl-tRNA formyltransferase